MRNDHSIPKALFGQLADLIINGGAKRVTKYLTPNLVVKATRKTYRAQTLRQALGEREHTIIFTVSRPNYAEHKFIKQCKKADVPFPVKKVSIVWLKDPKKGRKKR